ncbi:hypothetical protein OHV05_36895 (plasmid) [Kitasatospora sp. NBC_00070]|uniref:hypothetical protein n=1 Tax=Kitasatospora sp. NBC_00070 TaxID=2975962 RepID=UPI002F90A3D5
MADIWVLSWGQDRGRSGQLVRAGAITHLLASEERVSASRVESDEVVRLVGSTGPGALLPEDFHLALLVKLGQARKQARDSDKDLVLVADLDDDSEWDWSVFTVSELWKS